MHTKFSYRKNCQGLRSFPGWGIHLPWRIYCYEKVYFNYRWTLLFWRFSIGFRGHFDLNDFAFITFCLFTCHFLGLQIQAYAHYIKWKCWEMLNQRFNPYLGWHWTMESRLVKKIKNKNGAQVSYVICWTSLKLDIFHSNSLCIWY